MRYYEVNFLQPNIGMDIKALHLGSFGVKLL